MWLVIMYDQSHVPLLRNWAAIALRAFKQESGHQAALVHEQYTVRLVSVANYENW